jgi:pimeloyl-ACP methyl ester carboxylesterase
VADPAFIEANGLRFAYLAEGDGPLVVLVHGFPDTAHTWDEVRPALAAAGYRAVSIFTRGIHPTQIPTQEAYDADTLGHDVAAIIEALGETSAIVVGHDWGAGAGYAVAGLRPERVRMLVTMAVPHPAGILPTPKILWALRHFFVLRRRGMADKIIADDFAYIDELVARWSPGWDVPPGETDAVKRAYAEPGCLDAALGYYRAASPKMPSGYRRKITMPAAVIAGTDDIISPKLYERTRGRYTGPFELATMPGGHFLHREHPDRFNAELLRLLRDHAPA